MFQFELPQHLIAQFPAQRRDRSRLLVVDRARQTFSHHVFCELPGLLRSGDLLILNNSKVIPARLIGRREKTGGKWEGLYLDSRDEGTWEMLCRTRGTLVEGETVVAEPGELRLEYLGRLPDGASLWRPPQTVSALELLQRHGHVPLPPYIRKGRGDENDCERYQTVYASQPGSVAAPTAGLHFTAEVLDQLKKAGIDCSFVTLHVGLGTFQAMEAGDITRHRMHSEWCELSEETVAAMTECRRRGGRIVAVGTTSVRVIETAMKDGTLKPYRGQTDLFIHPPYQFKMVDAIVTNFHLPQTTLLVLVCAFAGTELMKRAYEIAIEEGYHFFSFGDAMLIL